MDKQTAQTFISSKNQLARARVASRLNRDELSREEISRCISIWATVYGLSETKAGDAKASDISSRECGANAELCLPSRPWMGRSVNSLKPFE